jgi:hypothetical protein
MKVSRIRKGILFVIAVSGVGLGCELIVDFDRTKIPVEGTDAATPTGDASPDAPTDAPVDSADADAGPAACNTVAFVLPEVEIQAANGAPPTPTGGAITPGNYALTQVTKYNALDAGGTGSTLRITSTITANQFNFVESTGALDGGVTGTRRENGTYTIMGAGDAGAIVLTTVCGNIGTNTYSYSVADSGAVSLYAPDPTTVRVFTKQP